MDIGYKLIKLRGDKTQAEVADDIGVTKSALSMYERDERVPRDEIKIRLAKYYGVGVEELFFTK
ncbi:helix-turn-helix transcriptional regulator [Peptostreptococcus faecalis]|uniref:helix-turn-helix transcriptional regulator n=1 Tax=Peptostreptococcus faecalis TaxID=2045015 RepID=UPI000C7B18EF|nr:helix-turn-helix transcriptional regulator [Peptostreptococcus faecalis]